METNLEPSERLKILEIAKILAIEYTNVPIDMWDVDETLFNFTLFEILQAREDYPNWTVIEIENEIIKIKEQWQQEILN